MNKKIKMIPVKRRLYVLKCNISSLINENKYREVSEMAKNIVMLELAVGVHNSKSIVVLNHNNK